MDLFYLQLLIFCLDGQEFVASLHYDLLCLLFIILLHLIFSSLRARSLFIPYAHVSIKSVDCILLSSFELKQSY